MAWKGGVIQKEGGRGTWNSRDMEVTEEDVSESFPRPDRGHKLHRVRRSTWGRKRRSPARRRRGLEGGVGAGWGGGGAGARCARAGRLRLARGERRHQSQRQGLHERCFHNLQPLNLASFVPTRRTLSFADWWRKSARKVQKQHGKGFKSLVILGAWILWKHRNACVFDGSAPSIPTALQAFKR